MCTKERVLVTSSTVSDYILSVLPPPLSNFCHPEIYGNIFKLYTDKTYGKIRIGCKDIYQTHRTKAQQVSCAGETHFGEVGGYAFSYSEKLEDNTVVICSPYFERSREHLLGLVKKLRDNKEYQKDVHQMNGKTRILLHEITHLAAIAESPVGKQLQSSIP
jgi:hypothetical protein